MGEPHTRSQPYLFFYHDPLKEEGEAADIKKNKTNKSQTKTSKCWVKVLKKADLLFAFPFTGHLPNLHKANCITRNGLTQKGSLKQTCWSYL